jgi:hypothetical protein
LERRELLTATILSRYTFYGNSAFDNGTSVAAAIARDKTALLPGETASFANYTSYVRGVNAIAVDVANLPAAAPTAADFVLRAGNAGDPSTWGTLSQGVTYSVQRGAGTGGSDRIVIRLPDGTAKNSWLQVTLNATADTGLSTSDVFYFGNQVGDDGHGLTNAVVDSSDEAGARGDLHTFLNPAPVTNLYDFNRDGKVDASDQLIARYAVNTPATALQYITAPALANPGTSGFSSVFNVKNYGAKGDGVTDDTSAIQAAANALKAAGAGLLYFPTGTFRISTFLNLQGMSNFEVRGFGATLMPLNTDPIIDITGDILRFMSCSNFTVSGLTFNGNAASRGHNANPVSLRLQGCVDFRVASCAFSDPTGDNVYIAATNRIDDSTASHDGIIEGCTMTSAYRNGISLIHGHNILIQSNVIQNVAGTAPQSGIDLESDAGDSAGAIHDINIAGNHFTNCAGYGVSIIRTQSPSAVELFSNAFGNCPSAVFNEGINSRVDNNVFHDVVNSSASPAQVYNVTVNAQTVEVSGNIFYNLTNISGVLLDQTWTGRATISSNRFSGIVGGGYGAIATWADGASILGNNLQNLPNVAINVMASGTDIERNVLTNGAADAIYTQGATQTIRSNVISGFPTAIDVRNPAAGTGTAVIDGNSVTNCPTGVADVVTTSTVTNNVFNSASKPATGPGASALTQVYLYGISGGNAQLNGNSFNGLTSLSAIYTHATWTGRLTVNGNQISNLSGSDAIDVYAPGAVVTGNTITSSTGGIAVFGDGMDIENNVIPSGPGQGIYISGNGTIIRKNNVSERQYGIYVSGTSSTSPYTTIDGNSISGCPTGILDAVVKSTVTNNSFSSATKPASGAGSDALGQLTLSGVTGGIAQVTANTFNGLTNLPALYSHVSWTGQLTVSGNQISNLSGSDAIDIYAPGAAVTGNTITSSTGGIAVFGDGMDIENNAIPTGPGPGIYISGNGAQVRKNTITGRQWGVYASGNVPTSAYTTVDGNTITGCPTGVLDSVGLSYVTNNSFSNASQPASGPGSDATAQVQLAGTTSSFASISGNMFSGITNLSAVNIVGGSGQTTISGNQINNVTGAGNVINVAGSNVVISTNTITNSTGVGVAAAGDGNQINGNSIPAGTFAGIYVQGNGNLVQSNSVTGRQYGIFLGTPATVVPTLVTTVNNNTISNCPTGVIDGLVNSAITNNSFTSAAKPVSGAGSDAVGQVTLTSVSGATALVSGNTFDTLTELSAIFVASSWAGHATLSNNLIKNISDVSAYAVSVFTSGATITGNTLQNISTMGIAVFGNNADIENNHLTGGLSTGIYAEGGNHTISNNTLVDYGVAANGQCIFTLYGSGNDAIVGNSITKTVPNPAWVPIVVNKLDLPGINYRYGVQGTDGAFTPGVSSSVASSVGTSTGDTTTSTSTTGTDTTIGNRGRKGSHRHQR